MIIIKLKNNVNVYNILNYFLSIIKQYMIHY